MTTTQKVLFKRKTTDEIEQLEIEDGSLIYNVENGKTYMDYGNERIQTGGNADTMIYVGDEEPTDEDIKLWIDTPTSETKASEIVTEYTESDKVGYSTNYINGLNGKVLWTNPNPNQAIGSQSLNLEDNDCDVFEIFYKIYSSRDWIGSVRFLKGYGATLQNTDYADVLANGYRQITGSTQTSISIGTYQHSNYTADNNAMVPIYVIGYKTGLFD